MPRPIIVAHRGLHHDFPENSIGAFRAARHAGIAWIECDVWDLLEGRRPVVIHDQTLDRTTTGTGSVESQTATELFSLRLRRRDGTPIPDERVPFLGEVVNDMAEYAQCMEDEEPHPQACGVLVEIKPPDARELTQATVASCKNRVSWMLQSFYESNLIHAVAYDVNTPVAYLVNDVPALEHAVAAGWDRIHLQHHLLDRATADRLHAAGVRIGAWTVNEPEDIKRVIGLGVEMLITDEPFLAQAIVNEGTAASVPSSGTPGEG